MARNKNTSQPSRKKKKKKHRGLRFFLTLIILLAAGGFVFYRGWIQWEIPEGHSAAVFTKTGGWDSRTYRAGEFSWRWERIFPTNMTLYLLPDSRRILNFTHRGTLPSGKVYAQAVSRIEDFSYAYELSLVYRIQGDKIPGLLSRGELETPEAQDKGWPASSVVPVETASWYERYDQLIQAETAQLKPPEEGSPPIGEQLRKKLEERFPALHFESITLLNRTVPDYDLYQEAKEITLKGLRSRENRLFAAETQRRLEEQEREERIDILRRYGEVFSEYPVLLDYFEMDPESPLKPGLPAPESP